MSKFKDIEHYQPTEAYNLLPFRFSRFEGDTYFLSNDVGDWLTLERSQLMRFIEGQVDPSEPLYLDLKSRNFLSDVDIEYQIEILKLRTRTKFRYLSEFTSLHAFVVTLRCEHSCPYCQVSRANDNTPDFDMSEETADRAIDLVFQSPSKDIAIEFQGGETLLNFDLIRYIVEKCERIIHANGKNLQFVIATNLAVLRPDMLEYCRAHNILISTSLDGPEHLHNKNRPRPGGDSFQRTIAGVLSCQQALGADRVSALMTTSQESLKYPTEIIDEYVKLEFPGIFLRPLSPYGFAVKTKWIDGYDMDEWITFYKTGLDYIIKLNKSGCSFKEYYASLILTKLLTPFETRYVDLMSPAGIGIAAVVYNYDGNVYASDESRMLAEMNEFRFRIGNVHTNSYKEIFTSEPLLSALEDSFAKSVPMCRDCAYEPFCGTDPVFHFATQRDVVGKKPYSAFCQKNMAVIKHLVSLLQEDSETSAILRRWVQ